MARGKGRNTNIYTGGGVGHCMDEGNVLMNAGVFLGETSEARERAYR